MLGFECPTGLPFKRVEIYSGYGFLQLLLYLREM